MTTNDSPTPVPEPDARPSMSDRDWEACQALVLTTQQEIRDLQTRGQLVAGVALTGAVLTGSAVRFAPSFALDLSLLVAALGFSWYLNLNAEVAAVAVYRDWLEERLNSDPSSTARPFRLARVGAVGRGHAATFAASAPGFMALMLVCVGALLAAVRVLQPEGRHAPVPVEVVIFALCFVVSTTALAMAARANQDYRKRASLLVPDGAGAPVAM